MELFESGFVFNLAFAFGYLKNDPEIVQDFYDPTTYFCHFNFHTRLADNKHTSLSCRIVGDKAYEFARSFCKLDVMLLVYENKHKYDGSTATVIANVLGWATLKELPLEAHFPVMTNDEYEFVLSCLDLYRKGAPLPTEGEVYLYKAVKNKWRKSKCKVGKDGETATLVKEEIKNDKT